MGLFARILAPRRQRYASPYVEAFMRGDDLPNVWGPNGRVLDTPGSLQVVAVYACVRVIAETLASLPLIVYRRLQPRGKERDPAHRLYELLHDQPNPEMDAMSFREALTGHVLLWGTGFAEIQRDQDDRIVALWPLRPDRMTPKRTAANTLTWEYRRTVGEPKTFQPRDLLTIPGMSSNGIIGYSPVEVAQQAIGLAAEAQAYGAKFFSNDSRPGGVIQGKGTMSPEAHERLRASWTEAHQGTNNAHKVAILEEEFTWQQVGIPPEQAQFLETRQFQVTEIARLFRIPPHLIQDLTRSTFTNIEHQGLEFVTQSLRPWAVRWEQAIRRCLLDDADRRTHFAEHLVDGLLRGDIQSRYQAYAIARNWGWASADDVRELENQNPLPDGLGSQYLVPLNMVPAGQVGRENADPGDAARAVRALGATGSAAGRLRLAEQYGRLFADAAGRIVAREVNDVRQAAERHLNRRDADSFLAWLRDYYERFGAIAGRTILPVMLAYSDVILEDAAAEVGSDDSQADELEPFVAAYAQDFGEHHADQSRVRLQQEMQRAADRGEDALLAIAALLSRWTDERPAQVASIEVTRLSGALVVERWKRAGVLRIRWVRQGSRSCPFCARLNGQVVGIAQAFANDGDELEGDDANPPLRVRRKTTHPPIHGACKCGLRPERG